MIADLVDEYMIAGIREALNDRLPLGELLATTERESLGYCAEILIDEVIPPDACGVNGLDCGISEDAPPASALYLLESDDPLPVRLRQFLMPGAAIPCKINHPL